MSSENKIPGSSNDIPLQQYRNFAEREKTLAGVRDLVSGQAATMARDSAQLQTTTVTPSQFDKLFGIEKKAQIVNIEPPPGFDTQFVPHYASGEFIFGAPSHLRSLESNVSNVQEAGVQEKAVVIDMLKVTGEDMDRKNWVLGRMGSLRQG